MKRARAGSLAGAACIGLVTLAASGPANAVCTPGGACAIGLGGTNAYATFGNTSALGASTFTLEAWVRRDGTGVTTSTGTGGVTAVPLVTKGRGEADGDNRDMNYFLGIRGSDGVLAADFEEGATGASPGLNHPVAGTTPLVTGTWYHVAATYDGTTWRLYLNGSLDGQLAVGQPPRADSIQHAAIGSAQTSTGAAAGFLHGALDEVRIWNVARSPGEIQASMNLELTTGTGLVARWGLNEGSGTAIGDSTGTPQDGSIVGSNWSWVDGSPFNASQPPAQPTLLAPSSGATGVSTSPTLSVQVSDPDGDPLTVTFYGRAVSAAPDDFTIVALPDTQYYTAQINGGSAAMFNAQTQWIVDNLATRNIAYVAQLGDCTENGNVTAEWQRADTAMQIIENPGTTGLPFGVPYGITVGNHDQAPSGDPAGTAAYNLWFGESRFVGRSYYGGHYGSDNDNHYALFSAGGMDFIVIDLEYDTTPDQPVLDWADALLKTHATRRGIVVSHHIIGTGNPGSFGTQGQVIYDNLKDNPNLDFMLAGHVPGEGRRQDTFGGNTTYTFMSDYQGRTGGGSGWLRSMTFSPANNTVHVETYSPWLLQSETDADSDFTVSYDMGGAGFAVIATNTGVPSGSSTMATWPGLAPGTQYEWYVTVSDGSTTTTGPIWTFTTGSAAVCGDGMVGAGEQCDDGNTVGGDCCSATCQFEASGSPCPADGNVCTTDVCSGAGTCGVNNTAPCTDGLFCNGADTCSAGTCSVHAGDPCTGGPECADACNETADNCFDPAGTACTADGNVCTDDVCDGTGTCGVDNTDPCDDTLFCNGSDTCSAGTCSVHAGNPCTGGPECADACNEGADNCFDPAGTACTADGNVCTDDVCDGTGTCGVDNTDPCDDTLFCNGSDTCSAGTCSVHAGNPCGDDGLFCNGTESCDETGDQCVSSGDPCTGGPECADVCDEGADSCNDPVSTPCDDGDACTTTDTCDGAGSCGGAPITTCDPGDGCCPAGCSFPTDPECTPTGSCTTDADCGLCERCDTGTCVAGARSACKTPIVSAKASVLLKDRTPDTSDFLVWKWLVGAATDAAEFGDPTTTDAAALCIFDGGGTLTFRAEAPAGGTCGARPCWKQLGSAPNVKGFKYKDGARDPDGLLKVLLKAGVDGRAKVIVKGKGELLPDFGLPLATPVTVQLHRAGAAAGQCWEAVYSTPTVNDAAQLRGKAD